MNLASFLGLLGGLALFLYGMQMMTNGLEMAAGDRLRDILERLTANRFVGVLVGAVVTALVQSSSATTLMIVGFVNAGIMQLKNAVWLIMGANIGTTITGQLVALDVTTLAPILAFVGVALIFFIKDKKINAFGTIFAGLGVLFIGMNMMSDAMVPLRSNPNFVNILTYFENPFLGILVGAGFTAIIQSSSASVGILQAMALSGVLGLPQAIFILFGQNIGTCITSVIGAIGSDTNGKRAAVIHVIFNIIGAALFVVITLTTPFTSVMMKLTPNNPAAQIANVHTIFNVVTTIVLLPFGYLLVNWAKHLVPEKPQPAVPSAVEFLNFDLLDQDFHFGSNALAMTQLFREVQHMLELVTLNLHETFQIVIAFDEEVFMAIHDREKSIDQLNRAIISFTSQMMANELPQSGLYASGLFLKIATDLERIGDHAINLCDLAEELHDQNRSFSEFAEQELREMDRLCQETLGLLHIDDLDHFSHIMEAVHELENEIDEEYAAFERKQIDRLSSGKCTIENSIKYSKILTDFERIGDHCLNIAKNFNVMKHSVNTLRTHEKLQTEA